MSNDDALWAPPDASSEGPKETRPSTITIPLVLVALSTALVMFVYEATKQFILPKVTIWQSHTITIIFSTILATVTAYFALWRQNRLNDRLLAESRKRERIEDRALQLAAIVNSCNDAIIGMNLEGTIVNWNEGAESLYGYSADEVRGQSIATVVPSCQADSDLDVLGRILRGESVDSWETTERRKDGREINVSISFSRIRNRAGQTIGISAIARDITQWKQTESELIRIKNVAEAASRAKGDFLANMSHEIRTPLNGIIGMTELALDTELSLEQQEYLDIVKTSADSLLTVINDILDFSKIEAGKLELDPVDFDLRNCVGDVLKTLALRAHRKGLELAARVHPDVPDGLIGDPGRLRQILANLVGNAVKFTEQGEVVVEITLWPTCPNDAPSTETATAHASAGDLCLHVSVSDTGIGIAPEKRLAIFDPFNQADSTTTRRYGGTGLGLTISARLVQLMDGKIWVESEVGKGSTFHFTVRLGQQPTVARRTSMRIRRANLHDLQVLVVDDNATNRRILEELLANWHMRPTAVAGAAEALVVMRHATANGEPFSLVLLDAMMPDVDGFTLAEQIKQDPTLAGATLMMLSSADHLQDVTRCRALGVERYLTKPVRQSDLLEAIVHLASRTESAKQGPEASPTHRPVLLPEGKSTRTLRILVAEDNIVNQRLAVRTLEKLGHVPIVACDGKEAVAVWEKQEFDLVLMDVQMPEMDGLEATAAIRQGEQATGKHIPIVAMTAHALRGDRERCLQAGMDGYVSKPIQFNDLLGALREFFPDTSPDGDAAAAKVSAP